MVLLRWIECLCSLFNWLHLLDVLNVTKGHSFIMSFHPSRMTHNKVAAFYLLRFAQNFHLLG